MTVTVIFKFSVGEKVYVLLGSGDLVGGTVRVLHVVGDLGNFYDVRVGRGADRHFLNNQPEASLHHFRPRKAKPA